MWLWFQHALEWFLHAECDYNAHEYDYDTYYDCDTQECDLHMHELIFNTMRVTLERTI
jgi:hypothetical protein